MNCSRAVFNIVSLLLLAGCQTATRPHGQVKVLPGISQEQAIERFGRPNRIEQRGKTVLLYYGHKIGGPALGELELDPTYDPELTNFLMEEQQLGKRFIVKLNS